MSKNISTLPLLPLGTAAKRILHLAGDYTDLKPAVETVAERLLADVSCPPTDLAAVCAKLKVIRCEEADIPTNGELRRSGKAYEIYYSPQQSASRRRFTIAHELGHAILESTGPRCPQSGEEVERICDLLATALLLPRRQFLEAVGDSRSPQVILTVAKTFEVSVMAAAFRFAVAFRASVFEVDDTRVAWGQGVIRNGYITADIKPAVDKALQGVPGEDEIMLNDGRSRVALRWVPLGYGRRALFTAMPIR